MSEEKKNAATEEVKEARQLTEEELENVNGGRSMPLDIHFKFYNDPPAL